MNSLNQLIGTMIRHAPKTGSYATPLKRLTLFRADEPTAPIPSVYEASFCLIVQGAKLVSSGQQTLRYDAANYLVVSLDLPLTGHIVEASADQPYLCCKYDLDLVVLADLIAAEGDSVAPGSLPPLAVYPTDLNLVDAACRLVKLLDEPEAVSALGSLFEREILYRLLKGPHGSTLRHVASAGTHLNQISRAIASIRNGYRRQLRIRDIAAAAGMSESSLHDRFKAVTGVTPLEYQKQLRLQEARRLMIAEGLSAGSAGFEVGYESPSQFSREYRRVFGAPPRQDVGRLVLGRDYLGAADVAASFPPAVS